MLSAVHNIVEYKVLNNLGRGDNYQKVPFCHKSNLYFSSITFIYSNYLY